VPNRWTRIAGIRPHLSATFWLCPASDATQMFHRPKQKRKSGVRCPTSSS
jgi:hypothetical protein